MQFDDYGNVVDEACKGTDIPRMSQGPSGKDRLTERFLRMNEDCIWGTVPDPPKLVIDSKVHEDHSVVLNEENWLDFPIKSGEKTFK